MDALILAGGRGSRLGGADKPALEVGGRSLLDRVLDACTGCDGVVVVGPERPTSREVLTVREEPPGGGPVAALAAGLPLVGAPRTALLAADLPFVTAEVLALLESRLATTAGSDGALLVDPDGHDQLLLGVWQTAALRRAVAAAGPPQGQPLGRLLRTLGVVRVPAAALPEAAARAWRDCDTPEDLREADELT
jgi:molybdopterin-guanine dinucleotide biosynthesis protein A